MDDKIYQKLNSIEDLNDRLLLKKVLNSVFTSLEQHSQKQYHDLEQRVLSEVENSQRSYNVFSTVQRRRDLDLTNEFLCPILSEDIEERQTRQNHAKNCSASRNNRPSPFDAKSPHAPHRTNARQTLSVW